MRGSGQWTGPARHATPDYDDCQVTDTIETPQAAQYARFARILHDSRGERRLLDADDELTSLSMDGAYAIQDRLTRLRVAEGRRHVGYKLGYTSAVMRRQMGVQSANHGPLLDDMLVQDGDSARGFLHPRVEPEIGVVMSRDLFGADLLRHEVADAIGEVRACLEIVDSIWRGYRFTVEQNTADGSSAAGVVLGPLLDVDPVHCHRVAVELRENDATVATATSAAASGHPLQGVAWLAARLAERGEGLRKGQLIITGGLTSAIRLRPGAVISAWFGAHTVVSVRRAASERDAGD
jgi:2-keto-4-pentenoate hydratase